MKTSLAIRFDAPDIDPFSDMWCQLNSNCAIGIDLFDRERATVAKIHFARIIGYDQDAIIDFVVMRNTFLILS